MSIVYFPAIIERGKRRGYGVFFPDLPGCVSAGDTLQEAARKAEEAVALHLEGRAEEGENIPEPRNRQRLPRNPDDKEAARILVRGAIPSDRVLRVNVTLPEDLLRRIDAHTGNRSRFLAEAAERALRSRSHSKAS